jgi:hypothetical protein
MACANQLNRKPVAAHSLSCFVWMGRMWPCTTCLQCAAHRKYKHAQVGLTQQCYLRVNCRTLCALHCTQHGHVTYSFKSFRPCCLTAAATAAQAACVSNLSRACCGAAAAAGSSSHFSGGHTTWHDDRNLCNHERSHSRGRDGVLQRYCKLYSGCCTVL